jgi:hypothetical protein
MNKKSNKFYPEVKERALRMVQLEAELYVLYPPR